MGRGHPSIAVSPAIDVGNPFPNLNPSSSRSTAPWVPAPPARGVEGLLELTGRRSFQTRKRRSRRNPFHLGTHPPTKISMNIYGWLAGATASQRQNPLKNSDRIKKRSFLMEKGSSSACWGSSVWWGGGEIRSLA